MLKRKCDAPSGNGGAPPPKCLAKIQKCTPQRNYKSKK